MRKKERKPKISYEPEADVIRMELGNLPIDYATEFGNVIVHFSPDNVPVYVEFLEASKFIEEISEVVRNPQKVPVGIR